MLQFLVELCRFYPFEELVVGENAASLHERAKQFVEAKGEEYEISHPQFARREILDKVRVPADVLMEALPPRTHFTVLLTGATGVGKSCFFNEFLALTGTQSEAKEGSYGTSVTLEVTEETRRMGDKAVTLIDTPGIRKTDMEQLKVWTQLLDRLTTGVYNKERPKIDMIWFCVNPNTSRLDEAEVGWMKQLFSFVPVKVVFLQVMIDDTSEMAGYVRRQLPELFTTPDEAPISVMARDKPLRKGQVMPKENMGVMARTAASWYDLCVQKRVQFQAEVSNCTEEGFKWKRYKAVGLVAAATVTAAAIGASPIPFTDFTLLVPLQVGVLAGITALYGATINRVMLTSVLSSLLGVGGIAGAGLVAGRIAAEIGKMIPGLNFIAYPAAAATASGLTAVIGLSYVAVAEKLARAGVLGVAQEDQLRELMRAEAQERLAKGLAAAVQEVQQGVAQPR